MLSTKLELHKLPGGGAQFPLCTVWAVHKEQLASEEYSMEREREKKRVTVEQRHLTNTTSSQVIKVNIYCDKHR